MDEFMNKYILKIYGILVKIKIKIYLNIVESVHGKFFMLTQLKNIVTYYLEGTYTNHTIIL